jgi:hypothetical protein
MNDHTGAIASRRGGVALYGRMPTMRRHSASSARADGASLDASR